jgi:hypothetical protein
VARLEADGVDEELLLDGAQGVVEETRLGPVVAEGRRALADEVARDLTAWGGEEASAGILASLLRIATVQRVGGVWVDPS